MAETSPLNSKQGYWLVERALLLLMVSTLLGGVLMLVEQVPSEIGLVVAGFTLFLATYLSALILVRGGALEQGIVVLLVGTLALDGIKSLLVIGLEVQIMLNIGNLFLITVFALPRRATVGAGVFIGFFLLGRGLLDGAALLPEPLLVANGWQRGCALASSILATGGILALGIFELNTLLRFEQSLERRTEQRRLAMGRSRLANTRRAQLAEALIEPRISETVPSSDVGFDDLPPAPSPAPHRGQTQYTRVLVVEDDPHVRGVLVGLLRSFGFLIEHVEDGRQALEQLAIDKTFDIIVTDVVMPGMGGYELTIELRRQGLEIPVILLSGYAPHRESEDSRLEPVKRMSKPFTRARLLEVVAELIPLDEKTRTGIE